MTSASSNEDRLDSVPASGSRRQVRRTARSRPSQSTRAARSRSAVTERLRRRLARAAPHPGDEPIAQLATRYGKVQVHIAAKHAVRVYGRTVTINGIAYTAAAQLARKGERGAYQLSAEASGREGLALILQRSAGGSGSQSARRKAREEIKRVVAEWAGTAQERSLRTQQAGYEAAYEAWSLAQRVIKATEHERNARRERLEAVRALNRVLAPRDRLSAVSLDGALRVLQARLQAVAGEMGVGNATERADATLCLTSLARLDLPATPGQDPELWDALTALREAR